MAYGLEFEYEIHYSRPLNMNIQAENANESSANLIADFF